MSETTKNCPNCGNEIRATATFCTKCGARFGESGSGETRVGDGPATPAPSPTSTGGGAHPEAGTGAAVPPSAPPVAGAPAAPPGGPPGERTSTPPEPPGGGPVGPKSMRLIGLVMATAVVGALLAFLLTRGGGDETTATPAPTGDAAAETTAPTEEPPDEFTPPPGADYAARITGITIDGGQYVVAFETAGFDPELEGENKHLHVFFDTVPASEAGVPGSGPWKIHPEQPGIVGESPYTGWAVSERPSKAQQMCVLVANSDHSVIPGTGNCVALP